MPKLLQVNVVANSGSTGKIAENIGKLAIKNGWESYIAYGRGKPKSSSHLIRIGNNWDMYMHGIQSRLFDNHGLASVGATRRFIEEIERLKPDVIHLHNIHGYYLNYKLLFEYLATINTPVVWTLHDCWSFTGHCAYFDMVKCNKWQSGCKECRFKELYPVSSVFTRSNKNYLIKKKCFTSLNNLILIPVSEWLFQILNSSFMAGVNKRKIYNGIDIELFHPISNAKNIDTDKFRILGVANIWEERKGLSDFIKLRSLLSDEYIITLVGLNDEQIKKLPKGINGVTRTNGVRELVEYYNVADVLVNPTFEDNFPTVNMEALACGTPVITYRTGGSPEILSEETGIVVEKGNLVELKSAIETIKNNTKKHYSAACRKRAVEKYNKNDRFEEYIELYNELIYKNH